MTRWITPALFLLAALYVLDYNSRSAGSYLVFPFIDRLLPSTQGDPVAMGRASAGVLGLLGLGLGLRAALRRPAED